MDTHEAAQILSVADHEVIDVRQHAGWWEAHHHDMASHEETWRRVGPADDADAAPTEQEPAEPAPARRKATKAAAEKPAG